MARLDDLGMGEVSRRVLQPDRLGEMLETYVQRASQREQSAKQQLAELRHRYKEVDAGIARLLDLVEKGLMAAVDPSLRERLMGSRYSGTIWLVKRPRGSVISLLGSRSSRRIESGDWPQCCGTSCTTDPPT